FYSVRGEICGTRRVPSITATAVLRGGLTLFGAIGPLQHARLCIHCGRLLLRARFRRIQKPAAPAWTAPQQRDDTRYPATHELKLFEHGVSANLEDRDCRARDFSRFPKR